LSGFNGIFILKDKGEDRLEGTPIKTKAELIVKVLIFRMLIQMSIKASHIVILDGFREGGSSRMLTGVDEELGPVDFLTLGSRRVRSCTRDANLLGMAYDQRCADEDCGGKMVEQQH
jgi:hypothetical protein